MKSVDRIRDVINMYIDCKNSQKATQVVALAALDCD